MCVCVNMYAKINCKSQQQKYFEKAKTYAEETGISLCELDTHTRHDTEKYERVLTR